jgi:hypothetical protein
LLIARIVKPAGAAVARELLCKHSVARQHFRNATVEEGGGTSSVGSAVKAVTENTVLHVIVMCKV